MLLRWSVALILLWHCGALRAQAVCPWLTEGTGAALMAGDVTAHVAEANGEGTCEFTRAAPAGSLRLSIAISHLPPKDCPAGERLSGVGQDAVFCSADMGGEFRATIRGRVRATYFLLTETGKPASASDKAALRDALEQAAEEVAGSLY
jgi:hypothetical protein